MAKTIWNDTNYQQFVDELKNYGDSKYREFHFKLLNSDVKLLGVRTPILKKIAKDLCEKDYQGWLKYNRHDYYEETVIHGLVITTIKTSWEEFIIAFDHFVTYIDNWAACDIVCANAKIFKKYQKQGLEYIKSCLHHQNVWKQRVGLVLLLDFYINDEYINKIFELADQANSADYYVKMAKAWLISICYIKYPSITEEFLYHTKMDNWTLNKTISKICDSKRVNEIDKLRLKKTFKR